MAAGSGEHRYRVVDNWAKLPDGRLRGVRQQGCIYVFMGSVGGGIDDNRGLPSSASKEYVCVECLGRRKQISDGVDRVWLFSRSELEVFADRKRGSLLGAMTGDPGCLRGLSGSSFRTRTTKSLKGCERMTLESGPRVDPSSGIRGVGAASKRGPFGSPQKNRIRT